MPPLYYKLPSPAKIDYQTFSMVLAGEGSGVRFKILTRSKQNFPLHYFSKSSKVSLWANRTNPLKEQSLSASSAVEKS
jgi:hypothetical protein